MVQLKKELEKYLEGCGMFLSVEWAKRWLPAVFLLLSLFLPWWTMYSTRKMRLGSVPEITPPEPVGFEFVLYLSFPWMDHIPIYVNFNEYDFVSIGMSSVKFSEIPSLCFVSTLILLGGLCGLSSKRKTRILGGVLRNYRHSLILYVRLSEEFLPSIPLLRIRSTS